MENFDALNSGGEDKLSSADQSSIEGIMDSEKGSYFTQNHQPQPFPEHGFLGDFGLNVLSPEFHFSPEEFATETNFSIPGVELEKEIQDPCSSTSFKLLKCYDKGLKRLSFSERKANDANAMPASQGLSPQEIIKIAGELFYMSSSQNFDVEFSAEDAEKLKLVELLLASADKVYKQQYNEASILLDRCDSLSLSTGNAVQRAVYYFAKALRDRIDQEIGIITSQKCVINLDEEITASTPAVLGCHMQVPFSQVANFAGIQTVIENVSRAKRIHIVDLGVRTGVQWTGLMQALVSQSTLSVELLKITAIGTTQKHIIEETGKRLERFAQSMNIPFVFKVIMVSDIMDLHENMFEFDANEEEVVIYSGFLLWSLVSIPDKLDSVMKVIRNLNPSIMVVIHPGFGASGSVVNRFVDVLYYFGALFDCLEDCMGDSPNRIVSESSFIAEGIRTVLSSEGEGMMRLNTNLDVWRALFARFGMKEIELGAIALCYANLIAKKFASWKSCTLEVDGKSLLIGWKGIPMKSLSAWRFS